MTRKKLREAKRVKECMFLGNNQDLKMYLSAKKKFFKQLLKNKENGLSSVQIEKVSGYVDAIEDMLDQKYFKGRSVYSMSEMVEEIKLERADLQAEIEIMEAEVKEARRLADEAFKTEGGYYANKFEERYDSAGQIELRMLVDEYQMLNYQKENLEKCRKILWWLLGVIHRPAGFFEKVLD